MTNEQLMKAGFEYVGRTASTVHSLWVRGPIGPGSYVMDREQAIEQAICEASAGKGSEKANTQCVEKTALDASLRIFGIPGSVPPKPRNDYLEGRGWFARYDALHNKWSWCKAHCGIDCDEEGAMRAEINHAALRGCICPALAPQEIPKNLKSCDLLCGFIRHCRARPGESFWQALRNWAGVHSIQAQYRPGLAPLNTLFWTTRNDFGLPDKEGLTADDLFTHGWDVSILDRWSHPELHGTYKFSEAVEFQARCNRMAERKQQGGAA